MSSRGGSSRDRDAFNRRDLRDPSGRGSDTGSLKRKRSRRKREEADRTPMPFFPKKTKKFAPVAVVFIMGYIALQIYFQSVSHDHSASKLAEMFSLVATVPDGPAAVHTPMKVQHTEIKTPYDSASVDPWEAVARVESPSPLPNVAHDHAFDISPPVNAFPHYFSHCTASFAKRDCGKAFDGSNYTAWDPVSLVGNSITVHLKEPLLIDTMLITPICSFQTVYNPDTILWVFFDDADDPVTVTMLGTRLCERQAFVFPPRKCTRIEVQGFTSFRKFPLAEIQLLGRKPVGTEAKALGLCSPDVIIAGESFSGVPLIKNELEPYITLLPKENWDLIVQSDEWFENNYVSYCDNIIRMRNTSEPGAIVGYRCSGLMSSYNPAFDSIVAGAATTVGRIGLLHPSTKLIYAVRNPVVRAVEHYYAASKKGNPSDLAVRVQEQTDLVMKCLTKVQFDWSQIGNLKSKLPLRCVYTRNLEKDPRDDIIEKGLYSVFLEHFYLRVLPRNIHVVFYDDLLDPKSNANTINGILEVVGSKLTSIVKSPPKKRTKALKIESGTLKLLNMFYRPFNQRLAALLNSKYPTKWNKILIPSELREENTNLEAKNYRVN